MRHFLFSIVILSLLTVSAAAQQTSAAGKYSKANLLIADGEYREAVEILDQSLSEVSGADKTARADILLALGKAHYYLNEFETAESRLKESASKRKNKHSETYYFLGLVSVGLEQTADATRNLNIAITADAKNAEAWYELGKLLYGEGSNDRAKAAFEKAVELGSTRSEEARESLSKIEAGRKESLAS